MNNLAKLFLLFITAFAAVNFVFAPVFIFVFDASTENIRELQEQSYQLGKAKNLDSENLQQAIIDSARQIKSQVTKADYLFIYFQQSAYNILCFLICALIFRKITFSKQSIKQDWSKSNALLYLLTPVLLVSLIPIIGETLNLNEWLGIDRLIALSGYDVNGKSVGNMIFSYAVFIPETNFELVTSIIFVAITPAIGEELFFRGSLQKTLEPYFGNIHNTIFVTALIFSAFHFEITAFFYRFFLGVLLGYVFFWSKNLLIPILIHALNNSMGVVQMFLIKDGQVPKNLPQPSEIQNVFVLIFFTTCASGILMIYHFFYKNREINLGP
jgi:membrane protease YdiL (CAAX protease family)